MPSVPSHAQNRQLLTGVLTSAAALAWLALAAPLWIPAVVPLLPPPVAWVLVRPSYGLLEDLALYGALMLAAAVFSVAALVVGRPARRGLLCLLAIVLVVLFPKPFNRWSGATFYAAHAAELDEVARFVESPAFTDSPDADDYYGVALPAGLAHLSSTGRVSGSARKGVFLPMWTGIPDDAGGLIWSPGRRPSGYDMYGMHCEAPVVVGGNWWSCGV